MSWTTDEWKGCYPSSWKGMIVPEAMAHPAKFSSKLIRRIYEHMRTEKWVKPGDRVIDPFGGVALGALDAMRLGLEWLGMELEVKFVDLGNHNISNWELKFGKSMPNWGSARLMQGDSRKMLEKLGRGRTTDSSPPYAETDLSYKKNGLKVEGGEKYERPYMDGQSDDNYGSTPGQLGSMKDNGASRAAAMISSPPFGGIVATQDPNFLTPGEKGKVEPSKSNLAEYGNTPGQLGEMETGNFAEAMRPSPPFGSNDSAHAQSLERREDKSADWIKGNTGWKTGYGNSDGQLADMRDGNFAAAMISSPPYAETEVTGKNNFKSRFNPDGQEAKDIRESEKGYQASISSPPFLQSEGGTPEPKPGGVIDEKLYARHAAGNSAAEGYGGTDGQLGNMGEGDFDQAVSSPPYNLPMSQDHNGKRGGTRGTTPSENGAFVKYGNTDGQLEGMVSSDETFASAVSSPPFEKQLASHDNFVAPHDSTKLMNTGFDAYGSTEGQIGNDSGSDFWTAARQIVEQVYLALAPGGHAVWVVKNYVKNKQMVPFSDQWRQLCEAVGFETLHEHRALLVHATSLTLDGKEVHKESKSFFRRLAEKKGSPRIDFETVYCMVKR